MNKFYFFFGMKLFLFLFFFSFQNIVYAQLEVVPETNATALANNLIGQGVVIMNPTLNCPEDGSGFFDGANSNIGLPSGVLLTSGGALNAIGPEDNPSAGTNYDGSAGAQPDDPDLAALVPGENMCDNCILEFDFQSYGDTLTFSYVFASEEYVEFFCGGFNDVFGFFITGINPAGGMYTNQNVALIPGTMDAVAINNIGPGFCSDTGLDNSALYVDNDGGATVQYDGFTVRLTATVPVQPCTDYHFKFGIGDTFDCVYDSGVFLEEGSFSSPAFSVLANTIDITDSLIYHKCPDEPVVLEIINGDQYNWTWTPDTNLDVNTGTIVTSTANTNTTYTLIGTDNADCDIELLIDIIIDTLLDVTCPSLPLDTLLCPSDLPAPDNSLIIVNGSCGNTTITSADFQSGGLGCRGDSIIIDRIYTVVDDGGTVDPIDDVSVDCVQSFIIRDTIPPSFNEAPLALDSIFECTDSMEIASYIQFIQDIPNNMSLSATDLCSLGPITIAEVKDTTDLGCTGQYIRTFTFEATDACGNSSEPYVVNIIVEDNAPPAWDYAPGELDLFFLCPEDVTDFTVPTATDLCNSGPSSIRRRGDVTVDGNCTSASTRTIRYTSTDDCGNTTPTFTVTVTVMDTIPPQWDDAIGAYDTTFVCSGDLVLPPPPIASNNCGDPSTVGSVEQDTIIGGVCDDRYIRRITYTSIDSCMNVSEPFVVTLTVDNTTLPTWVEASGALDVTFACDADVVVPPPPTAIGSCTNDGLNVTVDNDTTITNVCSNDYIRTIDYIATDNCGNVSLPYTVTITVTDTIAPIWTTPAGDLNTTFVCADDLVVPPLPEAMDNCGDNVIMVTVLADNTINGTCPNDLQRIIIYQAHDGCGNTSENFIVTLTVDDNVGPTWDIEPAALDTTFACSEDLVLPPDPPVSDNCMDNAITVNIITNDSLPGICPNSYIRRITYEAEDECGNTSPLYVATLTVNDTIPPTWNEAPGALDATYDCAADVPALVGPTAMDDCSLNMISIRVLSNDSIPSMDSCANQYVRTIVYVADDGCGNASDLYTVTITVNDDTPPTWDLADGALDVTFSCAEDVPTVLPAPTSMDNCLNEPPSIMLSNDSIVDGSCPNQFVRILTYQSVDACGNMAPDYVVTITVFDDIAPTWDQAPGDLDLNFTCSEEVNIPVIPTAADNCNNSVIMVDPISDDTTAMNCNNQFTRVLTYIASDDCGNESIPYTITITVNDDQLPTWNEAVGSLDSTFNCSLDLVTPAPPTLSDNCGTAMLNIVELSDVVTDSTCSNQYVRTITYRGDDGCGNFAADFVVTLTVNDNEAPTWMTPAGSLDATFTCAADLINPAPPIATDNCTDSNIIVIEMSDDITDGICPNQFVRIITYQADDGCGNLSAPFVITLTVNDDVAPTWDLAPGALDTTFTCDTDLVLPPDPTATDNCAGNIIMVTLTRDTIVNGACPNTYVRTLTFSAEDGCGNTSIPYIVTLTVADDGIPTWNEAPGDLDRNFTCVDDLVIPPAPTAIDNCTGNTLMIELESNMTMSQGCSNQFVQTLTYSLEDGCGNAAPDYIVTITVNDDEAPTWDLADGALDATFSCSEDLMVPPVPASMDNCPNEAPIVTLFDDEIVPGACPNEYMRILTYQSVDVCGNAAPDYIITLTVNDTIAPTWEQNPGDLDLNFTCSEDVNIPAEPTATDNCGSSNITIDRISDDTTSLSCNNQFTRVLTYIARDDCGNESVPYTITINVNDATAPTWNEAIGSLDSTFNCSLDLVTPTPPTLSDNCGSAVFNIVELDDVTVGGACPNQYVRTITYRGDDGCGNFADDFVITLTVNDNEAPTWATPPGSLDSTFTCATDLLNPAPPVATDNCTDSGIIVMEMSDETADGICPNQFVRTITYQADDGCGNLSVPFVVTLTVNDDVAPTWDLAPGALDMNFTCGADLVLPPEPTATDNCTGNMDTVILIDDIVVPGDCPNTYTRTLTYRAEDGCGNTSVDYVIVLSVADNDIPVWNEPDGAFDATFTCALDLVIPPPPSSTDNCSGNPIDIMMTDDVSVGGQCSNELVRTITYIADDGCGNQSVPYIVTLTVIDDVAPTWDLAPGALDITFSCMENVILPPPPTSSDNCTNAAPAITLVDDTTDPGACPNQYVRTLTYEAIDACGNRVAPYIVTITVGDDLAPTWDQSPGDLDLNFVCSEDVNIPVTPTATDNCGSSAIVFSVDSDETTPGICNNQFTRVVTYIADDGCGNLSVPYTITITVMDDIAPTWDLPVGTLDSSFTCVEDLVLPTRPTATDNCGTAVIEVLEIANVITPGVCSNQFVQTITWQANDGCGNLSVPYTATLTVSDDQAPTWVTAPGSLDQEFLCSEAVVDPGPPLATDNCPSTTVTVNVIDDVTTLLGCPNLSTRVITYQADDGCGNVSAPFTVTLTVNDTEAPTWSIPAGSLDTTFSCDSELVLPELPPAMDNCSGNTITVSVVDDVTAPGVCSNNYVRTLSYQATDGCGNNSEIYQVVLTVEDTLAPVWTPAPGERDINLVCAEDLVEPIRPAVTDNCGDNIVTISIDSDITTPGQCPSQYTRVITYLANDGCGNQSEPYTITITVNDDQVPVWDIAQGAQDQTFTCASDLVVPPAPMASDNCAGGVVVTLLSDVTDAGQCPNQYVRTLIYQATDDCNNNSVEYITTLTVFDDVAPSWDLAPGAMDVTFVCAEDIVVPAPPMASDNCSGNTTTVTLVSDVSEAGICANQSTRVLTYTANDGCGNVSEEYTITITLLDNIAPSWDQTPGSLDVSFTCAADFVMPAPPTATDNCDNSNVTISVVSDETETVCLNQYVRIIEYQAEDPCGNLSSIFTTTITVSDTEAPMITLQAQDMSADCGPDATAIFDEWILNHANAEATDNCGDLTWFTIPPANELSFSCGGPVEFYAVDACGNISESTVASFTLNNYVAPELITAAEGLSFECSGADFTPIFDNWIATMGGAEVTDPCETVVWTTNPPEPEMPDRCGGTTSLEVDFIATDLCGHEIITTALFRVYDTMEPEWIDTPEDLTISCEEEIVFDEPQAEDLCGETHISYVDEVQEGSICDGTYQVTRTWSLRDDCQLEGEMISQTITVVDTTGPVLTAVNPALIGLNHLDTLRYECIDFDVFSPSDFTAADNCDPEPVIMLMDPVVDGGDCLNDGFIRQVICTWIAKDDCNNQTEFSIVMEEVDTQMPELSNLPQDFTVDCAASAEFSAPDATDSCDEELDFNFIDTEVIDGCERNVTRTWYVSDDCGNVSTAIQTITYLDTVAPTFDFVPAPLTIACNDSLVFGVATAVDNCVVPNITFEDSVAGNDCETTYTRVWTATDDCGFSATAMQQITAVDTLAPEFTVVPADTAISCEETPVFGEPQFTDNCNEVSLTQDDNTTNDGCTITYTRVWIATDACGNASSASQTITATDTTPPLIINAPADLTIDCGTAPEFGTPLAADVCNDVVIAFSDAVDTTNCMINIVRTWTISDGCGNASLASATITQLDTSAPQFTTVLEDKTGECGDDVIFDEPEATDDCNTLEITFVDSEVADNCTTTYTRVWTATDVCGNATTIDQAIVLTDTTAPEFTAVPENAAINCDESPVFGTPEFTDNCSAVTIAMNDDAIVQECVTTYTRTWIISDLCGNQTTAVQTITATDTTAPVFTSVPTNSEISCEETPVFGVPVFEDSCNTVILTEDDNTVSDNCGITYTRVWVVTDACGNQATASQTIVAIDTTAPEFTSIPADQTIDCDADPEFAMPEVTDNCNDVVMTFADTDTGADCTAAVIRTWTATDACGNTATASGLVTIIDMTAPVFTTEPVDITVDCSGEIVFDEMLAEDTCSDLDITFDDRDNPDGCNTTFIRVWTATDVCGNVAVIDQAITLVDTTAPEFTSVPDDATIACDADPVFGMPTFSDDCAAENEITMTMEDGETQGDCSTIYTRTWTIADPCGNQSTAVQTIVTEDTTGPAFITVPTDGEISCEETAQFGIPEYGDDCNEVTLLEDDNTSMVGDTLVYTRVWVATDACGNSTTASQTIIAVDNTAPVITEVPIDQTINCDVNPEFVFPEATDNCSDVDELVIEFEDTDTGGGCTSAVIRTWTVSDLSGNVTNVTSLVTIIDTIAPEFTTNPEDKTGDCADDVIFDEVDAIDGCGSDLNITFSDSSTSDGCSTTHTRVWTATDVCGNVATIDQVIVLTDTTMPEFTSVPAGQTIDCRLTPDFGTPEFTDDCTFVSIEFVDDEIAEECATTYTRTWTITDGCGNQNSATQTIVANDVVAPEVIFVPNDITIACDDDPEFGVAEFNDDCSSFGVTFEDSDMAGDCENGFSMTRTWTATDICGNVAQVSQTVSIEPDLNGPVFVSVPNPQTFVCGQTINIGIATAVDDCGVTFIDSEDTTTGECPEAHEITRTWIAFDQCGNSSVASVTVTVLAETTTELFFGYVPEDIQLKCTEEIQFGLPGPVSGCAVGTIEMSHEDVLLEGACENSYQMTRTWTATDGCGGMKTCEQTLTITDLEAPSFVEIPVDKTVNCADAFFFDDLNAIDNCAGEVNMTFDDEVYPASCGEIKIRTWTVSDDCGNANEITQKITRIDNQAPAFTYVPEMVELSCGQTWNEEMPVATDDCGNVVIGFVDTHQNGDCDTPEIMERTWMATDACGNVATAIQIIRTVQDTEEPSFSFVPDNIIATCGEIANFNSPEAADNCSAISMSYEDSFATEDCTEIQTRTWTAIDACGNVSSVVRTITTIDNQPPTITALSEDYELFCGREPHFEMPSVEDNCSQVSITHVDEIELGTCQEIYTRIWTVSDACGNAVDVSQSITVIDNEAPVLAAIPATETVNCGEAVLFMEPDFSDNCANFELTFVDSETVDGCSINHLRTWTATDNCGLSTTAEQLIIQTDSEQPAFTFVPAPVVTDCLEEIEFGTPEYTDNCGAVTMTFADTDEEDGCTKTFRRTWTLTDACGNQTAETQFISIEDTAAPVFESTLDDIYVGCNEDVIFATPVATDNCNNNVTLTYADNTTAIDCGTEHTRMWTATDACGNQNITVQKITQEDSEIPFFTYVPADRTVACDDAQVFDMPLYGDDCSEVSLDFTDDHIAFGNTMLRTWVLMDGCGNTTSAVQTIVVADSEAPIFISPQDTYYMSTEEYEGWQPELSVEDNCSTAKMRGPTVTATPSCSGVEYALEYFARDEFGNASNHTIYVNVTTDDGILCNVNVEDAPVCNTAGKIVAAQVEQGQAPYQYHWHLLNGGSQGWMIEGETNQETASLTVGTGEAMLELIVTDAFGCVVKSVQDVTCVDNVIQEYFSVRPNPFMDNIEVAYSVKLDRTKVELQLVDMFGKVILSKEQLSNKGDHLIQFNLETLHAGTYTVVLKLNDKIYTERVIKM